MMHCPFIKKRELMKTKTDISGNTVTIRTLRGYSLVFAVTGVALAGAGMTQFGTTLSHVLISAGCVFTAGGILSYGRSAFYKLVINREPGFISILESSGRSISPFKIPLAYYSAIVIEPRAGDDSGSYDISFMSTMGSALYIAGYSGRKEAMDFARKLQEILKVDIEYGFGSLRKALTPAAAGVPVSFARPPKSGLTVRQDGPDASFSWKNSFNPAGYFFAAVMIYGFYHPYYFIARRFISGAAFDYVIYGLFILAACIFFLSLLNALTGSQRMDCSPDRFGVHKKFLGFKIGKSSLTARDIGLVKHSIGAGDNTITVVTRKGLETMIRLSDVMNREEGMGPGLALAGEIFSLRKELVTVSVSSLSVGDRFYIEHEILKLARH